MKKLITFFCFIAAMYQSSYAQEPVLNFEGELYFIPAYMTKKGESLLYSIEYSKGLTIYDGNFNVVESFNNEVAGTPYQERDITYTRILDPQANELLTDWEVTGDNTIDGTIDSSLESFEVYSDDNNYHSRSIYVSQTLFDNDDDFECIRQNVEVIPIDVKQSDYIKEHNSNGDSYEYVVVSDPLLEEYGADYAEHYYDYQKDKNLIRLVKTERYGGLYYSDLNITTLDGKVKATLKGISSISEAYYFQGRCYIKGYSSSDNCNVLYLIGSDASDIQEVSRSKAPLKIRQAGNNLIIETSIGEQTNIIMSTIDGKVVRTLPVTHGSNIIPMGGLTSGIYNVTLFRRSTPIQTLKINIKAQ